jgi:hypothetical protein
MPIGGTDAVPSVHGAFVLTIRHPTAIRWELTIQRTGLDAPAERESSLLSATLTLDVDTPSPPWQHIELRWDANEQHGDAHVRLLLDRAPEPTNATVIPTPTAGISAPPEPGPCPGSAQPPCGG